MHAAILGAHLLVHVACPMLQAQPLKGSCDHCGFTTVTTVTLSCAQAAALSVLCFSLPIKLTECVVCLQVGYMHLKFKRHRWFPKLLKNRDPLVLSVGWRRYQTLPVYSQVCLALFAHFDRLMYGMVLKKSSALRVCVPCWRRGAYAWQCVPALSAAT